VRSYGDDAKLFILAPFGKVRSHGPGKRLGTSRYGRVDPRICTPDGPSPAIAQYTGCRKGCQCPKCRIDAELSRRAQFSCLPLKELAHQSASGHRSSGYRQVMRRAG